MRIAQPLFPNDDGLPDPDLLHALAGGDVYTIVAALRRTRVFVALLAELESASTTESGLKIEQESQMSLTWLISGSVKALPVFSSIAAITSWNPTARPLGVETQRAAIVALADGGVLVLDPGNPTSYEVGLGALRSLALGYEYLPLSADEEIARAVVEALDASLNEGHQVVFSTETQGQGERSDLVITLFSSLVRPSEEQLSAFAACLANDERILLRLEGELEVRLAVR